MDQRTLLAISLSFLLLVSYQIYMDTYYPSQPPAQQQEQAIGEGPAAQNPAALPIPAPVDDVRVGKGPDGPVVHAAAPITLASEPVQIPKGKRVHFKNQKVEGAIAQEGGRLASLSFLKHLDKLPPEGKPIQYLTLDGPQFFFGETGFLGAAGVNTPGRETPWQVNGTENLLGAGEIRLAWHNDQGVAFEKIFAFSADSYLMTVTDRVTNPTDKPFELFHFAQFVRVQPAAGNSPVMAIADFEGPMGYLDNIRIQHAYEDLASADQRQTATKGWAGISDKYFLAALIPADNQTGKSFYFDYDAPAYRAGTVSHRQIVAPKESLTVQTRLFVGPKEVKTLERHNLDLERAIDYGWFHFLAEPIVQVLLFLNGFFHNFGVAIILLTMGIKLLLFPLANKSYVSMNAMKKLQPKIEELKKQHGDNRQALNEAMMKLYQTHKVNPLGGCLPIVVQIPVFFALYKVLFLSVEMRHAPFMLWIHDLSVMDPYYVLPILMGASMFFQSKLNPTPADPIQAKIMMFLPLVFTFMFMTFPAGLVLYWLLNNVLSIAQQYYILKKVG